MERIGLGYEDCRRINPRIIYAVGTGFGETGPYAHKGGQDVLAQAMSGVMARRADDAIPLSIYPTALADYTAGMHMVQGILFALLQRERTGEGQKVSVSLYNSMLAMQMQEAAMIMMARLRGQLGGDAAVGRLRDQHGALVLVGAFKANPLRDICTALGLPDLSPTRASTRSSSSSTSRAAPHLPRALRERHARALAGPPRGAGPAFRAGARHARGAGRPADAAQRHDHRRRAAPGARSASSPARSRCRAPAGLRRAPPRLGEHTEEVLAGTARASPRRP